MKSIKQQYIDLREGNMTQANFMRNLRMTMPHLVTNVTSFEDSVRILKNKGILTEADTSFEGKWKTVTGKDLYAHFKEIDNLNSQEVLIGIDYEIEKNPELTKLEAQKIVVKNLKKNPIYYTAQDVSGVEGYEPEYMSKSSKPEDWQMKTVKGGDMVDKKLGMQSVKGIEKPKKDSDKGGEANKMEKGVDLMSLVAKTVRGVKKMDATGEKMKKVTVRENKEEFRPGTNLNALQTSDIAKRAKAEYERKEQERKEQNKKLTQNVKDEDIKGLKERLKDMIRKELKEITGVYSGDAMTAPEEDGSSYVNEVDIYGIAGNPEEEMAARMARRPIDKYEPLSITKADRDRDLDAMLEDAVYDIDSLVRQVGNDVKLGAALISRARVTNPSLVPGLKQALNLYNK